LKRGGHHDPLGAFHDAVAQGIGTVLKALEALGPAAGMDGDGTRVGALDPPQVFFGDTEAQRPAAKASAATCRGVVVEAHRCSWCGCVVRVVGRSEVVSDKKLQVPSRI